MTVALLWAAGCGDGGVSTADSTLVVILAGQSNMAGAGRVNELMAPQRAAPANVRLWETGQFRALTWQESFGPEVGFADALAKAGLTRKVVLFKFAVGGSHLHGEWRPDAPTPGPGTGPREGLYPRMMADLKALCRTLEAGGEKPVVAGFIWMQGERDSRDKDKSEAYEQNLRNLVARVRADARRPDVPAVIGQIAPRMTVVDLGPIVRIHAYRDWVRAAQAAVAAQDAHGALVLTDDLGQIDNLHYDSPGQLELGRRFAAAWLKLTGLGGK